MPQLSVAVPSQELRQRNEAFGLYLGGLVAIHGPHAGVLAIWGESK